MSKPEKHPVLIEPN